MISLPAVELATFFFGLLLGSFLNVCIARLPAQKSIIKPGSHCPHCLTPIRWYDNIPVLSFLFLRGRCRSCSTKISAQYPLVELAVGLWFVFATHHTAVALANPELLGSTAVLEGVALAATGFLLIGVLVTDWQTQIIPDGFTFSGMALGFFLVCVETVFLPPGDDDIHMKHQLRLSSPGSMVERGDVFLTGTEHLVFGRLGAILAAAGILLAVRMIYKALRKREGLGLGDVKLLAMISALLGLYPALLALFLGVILCSLYAVAMLLRGKASGATRLPLGSFLAIGGLLAASVGPIILNWYTGLLR
ncbi:MAG: prepilin peptidase [Acidobacteriaceae bacterium]|nr:prepilin peptidase [Acidobacteriaceae bacterium]